MHNFDSHPPGRLLGCLLVCACSIPGRSSIFVVVIYLTPSMDGLLCLLPFDAYLLSEVYVVPHVCMASITYYLLSSPLSREVSLLPLGPISRMR